MPIGEFCNREVVIASPDTTVLEAAQLMRQHHVGSLVVVESLTAARRPVGVVTDRDLVIEVLAKEVAPESLTVGDLITGNLVTDEVATVRTDAGIFDTLHYMREHGYRRMPVVDDDGQVAGIVTLDDYLALFAEELTELTRLMVTEQQLEGKRRP
ncbi:MAG TPA: CBS domain-containing protein [Azonexus sp.]|nr:CBS domain-containing protein [Azonexus sp.]